MKTNLNTKHLHRSGNRSPRAAILHRWNKWLTMAGCLLLASMLGILSVTARADDSSRSLYVLIGTESLSTHYIAANGDTVEVTVSYDASAGIPQGAALAVEEIPDYSAAYQDYVEQSADTLGSSAGAVSYARFFDITILDADGNKVEIDAPVDVSIRLKDAEALAELPETASAQIVHFEEESDVPDIIEPEVDGDTLSFEAEGFSVYGIVYTVDFHYEVNGRIYDFSIPGGGVISLEHLVEVLGIALSDTTDATDDGLDAQNTENEGDNVPDAGNDFVGEVSGIDVSGENDTDIAYEQAIKLNEVEVSEATKKFVADVVDVQFSSPELVDVSKVEADTTVGAIKEARGLEVEYGADLTDEQIAEINNSTVDAGDWALISVHPFTSEESLTVTMKNGDQFVVKVTDAQITTTGQLVEGEYVIYTNSSSQDYSLKYDGTTYQGIGTENDDTIWLFKNNGDGTWSIFNKNHPEYYIDLSADNGVSNNVASVYVESYSGSGSAGGFQIRNFDNKYLAIDTAKNPREKFKTNTSQSRLRLNLVSAHSVSTDATINYVASPARYGIVSMSTEKIEIGGNGSGVQATPTNGGIFIAWVDENYSVVEANTLFAPSGELIINNATYTALFSGVTDPVIFRVNDQELGHIGGSSNWIHGVNYPLNTSSGYVTGSFNGNYLRYGTQAIPATGAYFDHWELNENRLSYGEWLYNNTDLSKFKNTDGSPNVLTAVFRDYYTFTVRPDDPSHGQVSGTDQYGDKVSRAEFFIARGQNVSGTIKNYNSLSASIKGGYKFDHWELRDGNTVIGTYDKSYLTTKSITLTKDGLELVACYTETPSSGGSEENTEGKQIAALLEQWKNDLTKDPLKVNKTAQVENYTNRIYKIDLSTSSNRRAVETDVAVNFIVDTSRSMYFPASITKAGDYTKTNLIGWLNDKSHDDVYFIIADKDYTATMYAVYWDPDYEWSETTSGWQTISHTGDWVYVDASYYNADDGETRTALQVRNTSDGYAMSSGSTAKKELSGVIYTAPERDAGSLWTRLDYLFMAIEQAVQVLYELDPNAQIGLTTFNADAKYEGLFGKTQPEIEAKLRSIAPSGGTNQTKGLNTAKNSGLFSTSNTKNQYAILVTDGAPVASGSSSTNWKEISSAAEQLRGLKNANNKDLILYTLGVSLANVGTNAGYLNAIATDSTKAYQADTGTQIAEAIEGIVGSMLAQATLYGTVSDTVDPAFYPVTSAGNLISPGYYDQNGNSLGTTQPATSEPYYKWENNNGTWTITWYNQKFAPENEGIPGWQKTFYIKAKEDFLGGNTIETNAGGENDKVTAIGFVKSDGTISSFDTPVSSTFETPYVNVDELSLDKHDTEWTVHLGTEVTPKEQIRELYNNTIVYEVVSEKDSDNRRTTGSKLKTESGFEAETFYLKEVTGELTDTQLTTLISTGTLNIDYTPYDASRYGTDHVGTITLTLTKSGEGSDYNTHHTTTVGTPTETYTLNVKYTPSSVNSTPDYHTTSGGSPGDPTESMEKLNTHKINVYAKKLTINKVDQANGTLTSPATFKLYRKAVTGDQSSNYESSSDLPGCLPYGSNYILVETLTTSNGTVTTKNLNDSYEYYLVETQAPSGYNLLTGYFTVAVDTQSTYTKTLDTSQPSITPWDPWVLSGWEETSTVIVTPFGEGMSGYAIYGDGQGSGYTYDTNSTAISWKIRNDAGIELPSTGGPGTTLIYLLGTALTVLALTLLRISRKKLR